MTRLPAENRDVTGVEYGPDYPHYTVGPLCAVPGCSKIADHAHHIWRRSFLTGDYGWVRLWDGMIIQNLCGLCYMHHHLVTTNLARITYMPDFGYTWSHGDKWPSLLLDPQPKVWASPTLVKLTAGETTPPASEHVHDGPGAVEKCPTCKRAMKRDSSPREATRTRKAWTITVPVDARENGADVLDTLLMECAKLFGHDEEAAKVRYHTLSQALALVVQHGHLMMSDA